jgi:hypothetical protein
VNGILDQLLVVTVIVVCLSYAVLTLGPRSLRRSLAQRLLRWLARAPRAFRRPALVARLERVGVASACGGCDSCGDAKTPAPDSREVKIPVATIGRRR